jgi:hypothetical protein
MSKITLLASGKTYSIVMKFIVFQEKKKISVSAASFSVRSVKFLQLSKRFK